ncbi:MAG: flavodoxin-dependent (E)-4-hydroxy-3-methylbut-2-enyl-diphosphate synthase [Holosporales bacterium]|jgi:(E)-4-hydroxy-3-methylbut-2-enyl-diphosphate synthase|nr:flavodoxin-dependent (E)-4-hydroxy-3-methylbut-2-enyl-diphosphate synthase [Holosporales bacterium]
MMQRRRTRQINVNGVGVGSDFPITVQTMTNSNTEDIGATLIQIHDAAEAGCNLIRVSCPTKASTQALRDIVKLSPIPVIADIHFHYKRALEALDATAACVRINPGNIAPSDIAEIVSAARYNGAAIRIGINSGSLEESVLKKYGEPTAVAIVESAVSHCHRLEDLGFTNFKVSVKSSDVRTMITAYRQLSNEIGYPLHLGVTEAGPVIPGTIKSAIGIGALLADGIGDTIRVSLSGSIIDEVNVGQQILKSLGLLANCVNVVSCPTCARSNIDVIQIASALEQHCSTIQKAIKISVLGCVVNGIGEAKNVDIGVFGFTDGIAKVYVRGEEYDTVTDDHVIETVLDILNNLESPEN